MKAERRLVILELLAELVEAGGVTCQAAAGTRAAPRRRHIGRDICTTATRANTTEIEISLRRCRSRTIEAWKYRTKGVKYGLYVYIVTR